MTVRHGEMTFHLSHVTCVSFVWGGLSLPGCVSETLSKDDSVAEEDH